MAVYTTLERDEIEEFLEQFGLGTLLRHEGVARGVENTNYFLSIDRDGLADDSRGRHQADYVLTLFETLSMDALGFYVDLLQRLAEQGLPVPAPIEDVDGIALHTLRGRPTLLTPRMPGTHPLQPEPAQCAAIGSALAEIHEAARITGLQQPSHRGLPWLRQSATALRGHLEVADRVMLDEQLEELARLETLQPELPQGIIHGDLFRDNTLFDGGHLTGIIDFFSAGSGPLLLDLAIVVNDWCFDDQLALNHERLTALFSAYRSKRPLTNLEQKLWPAVLRLAAFRFWISRLKARYLPDLSHRRGVLIELKDPEEYRQRLLWHRAHRHDNGYPLS